MINAVLMAGASKSGLLEEQEKVDNKAFVNINGRFMIEIILDVLASLPEMGRVVVVGSPDRLGQLKEKGYNIEIVPQSKGLLENMLEGVRRVDPHDPCLIVTADIPLITREGFEDFLSRCKPYDHDFYYPVISKDNCIKKFPDVQRTYMTLKEGTFTGGNILVVKPSWLIMKKDMLETYISYRKKPLKLVTTLPFGLIIKYFLRRLNFRDLEEYLTDLMGVSGKVVVTPKVEIGVDVDKPSDLELVRKIFKTTQ